MILKRTLTLGYILQGAYLTQMLRISGSASQCCSHMSNSASRDNKKMEEHLKVTIVEVLLNHHCSVVLGMLLSDSYRDSSTPTLWTITIVSKNRSHYLFHSGHELSISKYQPYINT